MTTREGYAAGLRALADLVEGDERIPVPVVQPIFAYVQTKDEIRSAALALGRTEKGIIGEQFKLAKKFSGGVSYEVLTPREGVCKPKVVGTEHVFVPDPNAPLVEIKRDIVEWECGSVLS